MAALKREGGKGLDSRELLSKKHVKEDEGSSHFG